MSQNKLFRNMPILAPAPAPRIVPGPPTHVQNNPRDQAQGGSLFDRIQQFKNQEAEMKKVREEVKAVGEIEHSKPVVKREKEENIKESNFKCQYCFFVGQSAYSLKRHVIRHIGPLKCSKCNRGFSNTCGGIEYHKKHEENCNESEPEIWSNNETKQDKNINYKVTKTDNAAEQRIDSITQALDLTIKREKLIAPNPSQVVQKEESSIPAPIVRKEDSPLIAPAPAQTIMRNSKFQEYFNKQISLGSVGPSTSSPAQPLVPKLPGDKTTKEAAKRKHPGEEKKSPRKQERNQFGPVKHQYEKFWCIGCDKWLPGGKSSVTSHLRSRHQAEQCPIIMITNQGMLKVDKEDFILDKHAKKAKMDTLNELSMNTST